MKLDRVGALPKMAPAPGPPMKTPQAMIAKPMPMRVPTLDLSAVSCTKRTGGRAMKMPGISVSGLVVAECMKKGGVLT